jgi:hypothetical protein
MFHEIVLRLIDESLRNIDGQLRPLEQLYPETVILTAMAAGKHHSRHPDNWRLNQRGDWANTAHRDLFISMSNSTVAKSFSSKRN